MSAVPGIIKTACSLGLTFLLGGDCSADSAFDEARQLPVAGQVLDNETAVEVEVKASSMRSGAKCIYTTMAQNGLFSQNVKLFPGQNLVTTKTSSGTTEILRPVSVEKPTLRVEFSYPGPTANDAYVVGLSYNGGYWPDNTEAWGFDGYLANQGIVCYDAAAGRYEVTVFHSFEGEDLTPTALSTTVRVYVNDKLVCAASNGNGIDLWSVGTFILHSGDSVGGYSVDENSRLDITGQGARKGYGSSGYLDLSVTHVGGPNGSGPVYLSVGDAAQVTAEGVLYGRVCGGMQTGQIIEGFTSSDTSVGDIDALGVFVAKAPGHAQISYEGYAGNPIDVYVLNTLKLVPDYNHDGKIDDADRQRAGANEICRFWINDDKDSGDVATEGSDVPGQSNANCNDGVVNGRCDLLDFFPVWLDIKNVLDILPPGNGVEYRIRSRGLKFVYTGLTRDQAGSYLRGECAVCGTTLNQNAFEATTLPSDPSVVSISEISGTFLSAIQNDGEKGVLMVEGTSALASLYLEVRKNGDPISDVRLPLILSGVEDMYRWVNLRGVAGGVENRTSDTTQPANFPVSESNGKQFVFIHGYSMHEESARAWNAEMFKRLWQSGSRAMYTAVTWFGNEGQLTDWVPFYGGSTPDYYANVVNAFETSYNLCAAVSALPGQKIVAGHSLGNMLISSAIVDCGMNVSAYFMLNAAVAMEAYNSALENQDDMRNPVWQNYSNRLFASEWYSLFDGTDGRNGLTWRNRFGAISFAYNYYSSTEDVLANANGSVPSIGRVRSWVNQEMRKGTTLMWLATGDCEAGWGFNTAYDIIVGTNPETGLPIYDRMLPSQANILPDASIRTNSFFAHFDDEVLYGTNGSTVAQQPMINRKLLADAIPALSNPSGRNALGAAVLDNYDDMQFKRGDFSEGDWPREQDEWRHSDIKDIAYPFNFGVFDQIITDGGLK